MEARRINWRPYILGGIVILIISQILLLSPSTLEQTATNRVITPESVIQESKPKSMLAQGIPTDRIADYTVEIFNYASTQNGQKQWRIHSQKAYLFNKENLVHAIDVMAYLYDPDGKITEVKGKEAKYYTTQKDLEVYGDVHSKFPDGFQTESQYLRYRPGIKLIVIPEDKPVAGAGVEEKGQNISFTSLGLEFKMGSSEILLPKQVRFVMTRQVKNEAGEMVPEDTVINSDICKIDRAKQIAHFSMYPNRPLDERLVQINEPTMYTRARRADVNYGDHSQLLHYMTAFEDVLIKEKGKTTLRYATGGRADFDSTKNVVLLSEFPQVYQDNDTVTGDVVILHRDTDVVEVEHSNAFSEGQQNGAASGTSTGTSTGIGTH